uniref:Uncharacterized protein n=1 Tax=Glossina pallidipes TaxID=7398 RepID=A0A1B0A8P5_GLOPL
MKKINIENDTCLYFNHNQLIDEQYKSVLEENDVGYNLKAEFFNFSPRLVINEKDSSDSFKKHVDKNKPLLEKRNLIGPLKGQGLKQPYETLYVACHKNNDLESVENLRKISFIFSIPSIIHCHKTPLCTWLKEYWPGEKDLKCLEIFAACQNEPLTPRK